MEADVNPEEWIDVACPWCGESFAAPVDASAGDAEYIEDCPVCCQPIAMQLRLGGDAPALHVRRDD